MARLVAQRLLHGLTLLLGVSLLTFLFSELAPGDFLLDARLDPSLSSETVEQLRARLGLDDPLPVRYGRWLAGVLGGNLGDSLLHGRPVAELLWQRSRNTLLLTVLATALAWLVALPLGIWAAEKGRARGALFGTATSLGLAIPDLVLGLGLLMVAVHVPALPVGGMTSPEFSALGRWQQLIDLARHLLLPTLALVLTTVPLLARHVQSSMADVLASPYMQAVRARGVGRRRRLLVHALPAAANPLISLLGFSIGGLLSASLLIEVIMSWPGVGDLLFQAIQGRDIYVVIGAVMTSTALLLAGNFFADLLLLAIDPRIRTPAE